MKAFTEQRKLLAVLLLCLGCLLALCGCGKSESKKMVVAMEATFAPYEFYQGEKIVGIDVDIVTQIAKELGKKVVFEDTSFDYILEAVASGKADMAASGITITEKRKEKVDFSIPYAHAQLVVVVPEQSNIRTPKDLKGKLIGVQKASTSDEYVAKHYKSPSRFPNVEIATTALLSGKLDAIVLDGDPARVIVKSHPYLRILKEPLSSEDYGFAIRKGQPELLEKINKIIRKMLADRTIERISDSYYSAAGGSAETKKKQLRVAIDPTFPPFNYLDEGKPAGVELDVLNLIAKELGMELQLEQVSFDLLLKVVQHDNGIDLGASQLSITDERKKSVDFSVPYTTSSLRLMCLANTPALAPGDLKNKNIGVVFGSTAESYARKNKLVPLCYSDNTILVSAVRRKEIDLAFIDDEQANIAMRKESALKCLPDLLQDEQCAFAVSKRNKALLEQINTVLKRLIADGTIQKLREKHVRKLQK